MRWPPSARTYIKLNLLALAFVLAVLLVAFRRLRPALAAVLLPTAVAAYWATGLLFPPSPHRLEPHHSSPRRRRGRICNRIQRALADALPERRSSRDSAAAEASVEASVRVGPAIVASALALVFGFAVLAISPVPMVRDFGLWSGADLLLATVAVLVLLPPVARRFVTRVA